MLEGERGVHGHFFAVRTAEGFGPCEFARVALHFEVLVAFGAAEAEDFGIVADEGDALGGIGGLRAEVAGFDSVE